MAERKSQNKYYPPDWDPVYGSINLMVKARKPQRRPRLIEPGNHTPEYGRKVRFEMPFSVWCDGCGNHIGQGVRYHALRAEIGKYHTTVIQRFRFKCHLCPNYLEIHTDPQNSAYKIAAGCRKRIETYDPKDAEVIALPDKIEVEKLANDAFYKLEHNLDDTEKAEQITATIEDIQQYNEITNRDPYAASQVLRRKFRNEKKSLMAIESGNDAIKNKLLLSIPILPETDQDSKTAAKIVYNEKTIQNDKVQLSNVGSKRIFKSKAKSKNSARDLLANLVTKSRNGDPFRIQ